MFITNNGERYYNSRSFKSSNRKEDPLLSVGDLDLENTGGPGGKTPEQIEQERVKQEEIDAAKAAGESTLPDLIKEVENDYVKSLSEDQLSGVIAKYEGAGFDKDGNIVDTEGKVLKTPDEIKADIETVDADDNSNSLNDVNEVTLKDEEGNDIVYKLDDNKDAVDADGNVIKTKAELLTLLETDSDDDDSNYIDDISAITGFKAIDDKGEEVTFENTVEGLAARESHIIRQEATKLAGNEINTFFDKNPDILEMMDYKKVHGSLKDYATHEDYSKIVLEDSNDDQHKAIIIKAELAKGNSDERAKTVADLLMQDGKGKAEAEASLKFLVDKQTSDRQSSLDATQVIADADKVKQTEYFTEVAEVVKSGKANGFTIPEFFKVKLPGGRETTFTRNAIFQLITEPILEDGSSRYDAMKSKDTVEDRVLDAYLRLVGYDTGALVTQKANNNKVLSFKSAKKSVSNKIKLHRDSSTIMAEDIK